LLLQTITSFQTLSVTFERELIDGAGKKEISRGIIYFQQKTDKLIVRVYDPINQVLDISGKTLILYYPDQRTAFEIQAKIPFMLPFVSTLVAPNRPNFGLTDMGYQLERSERHGDTLTSSWLPPKISQTVMGKFKLVEYRRKLLSAQSFKPDGRISTNASFSNYTKVGNTSLALDVTTSTFRSTGTEQELVRFSNPEFNKAIPDSIVNFKIPPGTPMKHIQW
jgi:outer membrane lipoprotein-sorting protein